MKNFDSNNDTFIHYKKDGKGNIFVLIFKAIVESLNLEKIQDALASLKSLTK